jgi:hypothetical protein
MDLWGGNLEQPPLDQQQVDQGVRQQNAQHAAAIQHASQQQSPNPNYVDVEDDPIGHFQQRIGVMEGALAAHSVGQQFWTAVDHSEAQAKAEISDYEDAIRHLETNRWNELVRTFPDAALRAQGYTDPNQVRMAMLNQDRIAVARHAMQQGVSPAAFYYDLACSRGYQSTRGPTRDETRQLMHLADRDPATFDKAWDWMARKGLL